MGIQPAAELIVTMALWGGVFVVARASVRDVNALVAAGIRFIIASIILVVIMTLRSRSRPIIEGLKLGALPGLVGVFAYNALLFIGLKFAPAIDGGMIVPTLNPIVTTWLAALLFKERIDRAKATGLGLALAGQSLVFWESLTSSTGGPNRLLGDFLLLGAAMCWSAYTLTGKHSLGKLNPLELTVYSCITGGILLVVTALPFVNVFSPADAGMSFWLGILYLAFGGTVVAFFLWHRGVQEYGAAKASAFLYLIPVFALLFAALFLKEAPTVLQLVGVGVVLTGVGISNRSVPGCG